VRFLVCEETSAWLENKTNLYQDVPEFLLSYSFLFKFYSRRTARTSNTPKKYEG